MPKAVGEVESGDTKSLIDIKGWGVEKNFSIVIGWLADCLISLLVNPGPKVVLVSL